MNILKESSFSRPYYEEGEKKGEIIGAKKLLIHQGRARFGRLDKATRAKIESIDEIERLEVLSVKLLNAASWAELLTDAE
jgi:hypothetical protein